MKKIYVVTLLLFASACGQRNTVQERADTCASEVGNFTAASFQECMNKTVLTESTLKFGAVPPNATAQKSIHEDKCQSYGFQPKTKEFAECMMRLDIAYQQEMQMQQVQQNQQRALDVQRQNAQSAILQNAMQANSPINCYSLGNHTSCY